MIEADRRKAIYLLHEEGMPVREIARRLGVARSTAAEIVAQQGEPTRRQRLPRVALEANLLRELHAECDGYVQRVHVRSWRSGASTCRIRP